MEDNETNAEPVAADAPSPIEADAPAEPPALSAELAVASALPVALAIAPGVERLERPTGTAAEIPETLLRPSPSPLFLTIVATASLVADVASKLWAESRLDTYPGVVTVVENHLQFVLARNKGGAWGLLQGQPESIRRPFFLLVSVAAIAFIVTLYQRLQPKQHALKWGLPLVLGGALGNVFDRVRYGHVIDFIDYRADWIKSMNTFIQRYNAQHIVTDHWPTFNIADVAICVGVALMAIDMLTSKRGPPARLVPDPPVEVVADAPLAAAEPVAEAPVDALPTDSAEAAPSEAASGAVNDERA